MQDNLSFLCFLSLIIISYSSSSCHSTNRSSREMTTSTGNHNKQNPLVFDSGYHDHALSGIGNFDQTKSSLYRRRMSGKSTGYHHLSRALPINNGKVLSESSRCAHEIAQFSTTWCARKPLSDSAFDYPPFCYMESLSKLSTIQSDISNQCSESKSKFQWYHKK